jgi:hypothetical protein
MTEYVNAFMQWIDETGPLIRVPFVIGLALLYWLIFRFIKRVTRGLADKFTNEKRFALRIQSQVIVSANDMTRIIVWMIRAIGLTVAILIGFSFLNMAMGLYEWSRGLASDVLSASLEAIGFVIQQIVDYIPSLLVIVVVLLVVRFILHVIKLVFVGIGNGRI